MNYCWWIRNDIWLVYNLIWSSWLSCCLICKSWLRDHNTWSFYNINSLIFVSLSTWTRRSRWLCWICLRWRYLRWSYLRWSCISRCIGFNQSSWLTFRRILFRSFHFRNWPTLTIIRIFFSRTFNNLSILILMLSWFFSSFKNFRLFV